MNNDELDKLIEQTKLVADPETVSKLIQFQIKQQNLSCAEQCIWAGPRKLLAKEIQQYLRGINTDVGH